MKVSDKYDLIALHRCLLEAKFNPNPSDYDIAGSPIVAKLANQVIDHLEQIDGDKWREWRAFDKHAERVQLLIMALQKQSLEHINTEDARMFFIENALAPIIASEEEINTVKEAVFSVGE